MTRPEPPANRVIARSVDPAPPVAPLEYELLQLPDGSYLLWWGDGVANTWEESYDSLPIAFARLAALLHAVEADRFFRNDAAWFADQAAEFLAAVVHP